ncbi:MAG: UbiD family decarboxylase [Thermodesulfobacteriota bacterium]
MNNLDYLDDLRVYMKKLEEMGELKIIDGADWNLEIGTICEGVSWKGNPFAILFDNIKDYPKGFRLLTNAMRYNWKRMAFLEGLIPAETPMEQIKMYKEHGKNTRRIPPQRVDWAPFMENIDEGENVDIYKFPTPKYHEKDGGRYIGTGCVCILRDPDSGYINLGVYRVMILDRSSLVIYVSPGKDGRVIIEKYARKGDTCPIAITFGQSPLLYRSASKTCLFGDGEYGYAGGLRGKAIEVVEGKFTGLPIPISAEIAIEGEILPGKFAEEGPFGEWTGYYGSGKRPEPVIDIKRVMYRNDPIMLADPPFKPLFEAADLGRTAQIWKEVEAAGLPGVKGVWIHGSGGPHLLKVISIKQSYPGHAVQAGMLVSQCKSGSYCNRYTIVVDEDVDPSNTQEVLWAMCTRSDPENDIHLVKRSLSTPLDPIIPPWKKKDECFNSRVVIDATRPYEWRDQFPEVNESDPVLRKKVMEKWWKVLFG